MAKKAPKARFYRSRNRFTRYRLSFSTPAEYFVDTVDERGKPTEPPKKGWAYYLSVETYDQTFEVWDVDYLEYGVVRTVREAEDRAGRRVAEEESRD